MVSIEILNILRTFSIVEIIMLYMSVNFRISPLFFELVKAFFFNNKEINIEFQKKKG